MSSVEWTTPEARMLAELADVARAKGLKSVTVDVPTTHLAQPHERFSFELGELPRVAPSGPTLLPISRPIPGGTDAAAKAKKLEEFRLAVECAHIHGYPNPADYGLEEGDVT
jgi:hypothetical protein